jgi:hypothetical protein
MSHYRQSILLFGFVLPLLLAAILVGSFAFVRGKVLASFEEKRAHYSSYERERLSCIGLEAQIVRKRPHVARWSTLFQNEAAATLSSQLKLVSAGIPAKEYQNTSFNRPNSNGNFGAASQQASTPIELSFRSTFRAMQQVLLGLETRMPQLQLDELRIDRTSNANTLNFQVKYTIWES